MKKTRGQAKRNIAAIFCTILSGTLIMSGCAKNDDAKNTSSAESTVSETASSASEATEASDVTEPSVTIEQSDIDESYDEENSTKVSLSGTEIKVTGSGAAADGSTLNITSAGTYVISGKLTNGQIVIKAGKDDTVKLVLKNAEITSSTAPAIYASQCGKTVILLDKDTTNSLTDGSTYTAEDDAPNAALFVQDDLTILGTGTLDVTGKNNNAVTSKDTLKITGGTLNVTAAHHGITGKDNLYINGASVTVKADTGDGIRSTYSKTDDEKKGNVYIENSTINITSAQDGIQAERGVTVNSGDITVITGGGSAENKRSGSQQGFMGQNSSSSSESDESTRGIKAGTEITVTSGFISVDSYDDAFHSNGNIDIKNGELEISSGDDGIHADDTVNINGGNITIKNSYEGIEGESINISGGITDITSSDDGINCAGGNDQSGFGGMDGNMEFRNFRREDLTQQGNTTQTQGEMPQGEMPQGEMPQGEMPQGEMPRDSGSEGMMNGGGMQMDVDNNAELNISGGTIYVNAQGDGIDSNGAINMTDGTVIVNGTTSGGNGIIDHGGSCTISGGTIIGAGTSDMLEMPDEDSQQNTLVVLFENNQSAGSVVYVADSSGKVIAAMSPLKNYGCFILSSAELKSGETYTVYTGGKSNSKGTNGYIIDGNVSGGTEYTSFTLSDSKVTYVNKSGVTQYNGSMGGGRINSFEAENGSFGNPGGSTENRWNKRMRDTGEMNTLASGETI